MSLLFGQYVRGSAAGARVFEYMNLEPTIPIQGGLQITNNNLRGQVSLNNVTFTYPSRPEQSVLEDFNLEIPGGKVCALVGASGGGKSTVASLLERFYDCDNGSLTIDGIDIKTLDLRWLRRNCIGYINQVFFSFSTYCYDKIFNRKSFLLFLLYILLLRTTYYYTTTSTYRPKIIYLSKIEKGGK